MTSEFHAIWLDVDGTSETGQPNTHAEVLARLDQPPLNRPYNYSYALFEALKELDMHTIWFFTAYSVV